MRVNNVNSGISFQAVNQKYLERGLKEARIDGSITSHLITCLEADVVLFKNLSVQDGLDTLKALEPYTKQVQLSFAQAKENFIKRLGKQS